MCGFKIQDEDYVFTAVCLSKTKSVGQAQRKRDKEEEEDESKSGSREDSDRESKRRSREQGSIQGNCYELFLHNSVVCVCVRERGSHRRRKRREALL